MEDGGFRGENLEGLAVFRCVGDPYNQMLVLPPLENEVRVPDHGCAQL